MSITSVSRSDEEGEELVGDEGIPSSSTSIRAYFLEKY
jgi:hypothetical protein